ncbi:Rab3 GTPase-activating protein catalytic subunit [Dissophora globulifera]|nr:Rab3 GTPase-activating protein catalytic subunit [Dissophora globulifera]
MDDFENFEFIDYTTSGPWERFITQIEDSLRSWGLVDGSLGVLDPAAVTADTSTFDGHDSTAYNNDQDDHIHIESAESESDRTPVYQLREMLSLDDATYALSYHYHPAKARAAAGVGGIDLDFLPTTLEGVHHHSLHRWTSLTHILTISPVTISDIFASNMSSSATSAIIDLSSAKLLISSFSIAFQNTGCNVPIFVPTGQPWNLTFAGLLIQPQAPLPQASTDPLCADDDLEFEDNSDGLEVRFNTVLVPYPPVQYSHLSGIMDFFISRMSFEDDAHVATAPGDHSQHIKDQIYAAALFCYDLVNWYDEDWRRWKQPEDRQTRTINHAGDDLDATFQVNEEPTMTSPDASMNMDDIKAEGRAISTLPVPVLPFGPVQDPLRSMRLSARFAMAPSSIYLDSKYATDMDASSANIWILQAAFKEDDYGILGGIMEDAVASWSSEVAGNRRRGKHDRGYGSLLHKGARLIQGTITMVDAVDVENIVDALFAPSLPASPESTTKEAPSKEALGGRSSTDIRVTPASELGLHFRHATTVPYRSFLWRMIQYLLDVISPTSDISYATSVMGFMKVLWTELLKQFYARWEDSQLIPLVDIYGQDFSDASNPNDDSSLSQGKKPVAIDLRYSLLHQKLAMLNCCIVRQVERNNEAPGEIHPVLKHRQESLTEFDSEMMPSANTITTTAPGTESAFTGRAAQFQNLLHGLSDISRPRSADVVPMAKRLLETVKNRAAPSHQQQQQQQSETDASSLAASSSFSDFSTFQSVSKTEPSSPTAAMPIPKRDKFRRRRSSSSRHPVELTLGSDEDDDVFYETSELIMDPYEIQRRAHSLSESFVTLKYSSSADSQSGVLVNDLDQSTVNANELDPREVVGETKSEGGLMPLKDLKLLKTGEPLLIPKLQEPGYMTEDMIQIQEKLFETLGSSSDGAKMRAKMQSTQLTSDMEAFKAANPGCVLGDFIRWHSPKDWIEDKGEMSARMADAGNYWQELWAHSKRIPVSRQTPLFNYNQEAAKVLFFLEGVSADQLFLQLLPTMCLISYDTLASHPIASHIRQVAQSIQDLGFALTRFPWNELSRGDSANSNDNNDNNGSSNSGSGNHPNRKENQHIHDNNNNNRAEDEEGGSHYTDSGLLKLDLIIGMFRDVELLMGRAIALVRKFPEQFELVERILGEYKGGASVVDGYEAVVEDGAERECVYDLFSIGGSLQSSFPQPTSREFILETYDPLTDPLAVPIAAGWDSRPMQRRMYACFKESEVRIVEAIAKDGMYM